MKSSNRTSLILTIFLAIGTLPSLCWAQSQPVSLDSSIEVVRAGVQADRVSIITAAMHFNEKDGSAFWPIYRKYEYERSTLDDRRVAVITEYAAKYPSLSDADAKAMAKTMFDCDTSLAALKKKYYKKFNAILPAYTVTKFFQLDYRLDLLMQMNVESSLPPLEQPQQSDQQN